MCSHCTRSQTEKQKGLWQSKHPMADKQFLLIIFNCLSRRRGDRRANGAFSASWSRFISFIATSHWLWIFCLNLNAQNLQDGQDAIVNGLSPNKNDGIPILGTIVLVTPFILWNTLRRQMSGWACRIPTPLGKHGIIWCNHRIAKPPSRPAIER